MKNVSLKISALLLAVLLTMPGAAFAFSKVEDCPPGKCCCKVGGHVISTNMADGCHATPISIVNTIPRPCCHADQLPVHNQTDQLAASSISKTPFRILTALNGWIEVANTGEGNHRIIPEHKTLRKAAIPIYLNTLSIRC